jgi:hypothetical protein
MARRMVDHRNDGDAVTVGIEFLSDFRASI